VLALLSGVEDLPPVFAAEPPDVLDERCATPGLDEPPPQPASSRTPLLSTTTLRLILVMSRSPSPSVAACRHHLGRNLRIG
jgi:hypothetical protein